MATLKSKFADDIVSFLELKKAFGTEEKSLLPILKRFDSFCFDHYPNANTLERHIVLEWLSFESETSNTKQKSGIIRQLGKYLSAIGKTTYILPENFVLSKTGFTPYIPSDTELSDFFEAADSLTLHKLNPRRHLIAPVLFRLLYTCGLRPNEGRELKTTDVNLKTGEIIVRHNKQRKERIVVMSNDMLGLASKYNAQRQRFNTNDEYFFPGYGDNPYTSACLHSVFKTCWRKANSNVPLEQLPNFRPYDLRHCFASSAIHRWLDAGRDMDAMLPYLRAYMGHENFSSTIYYLHLLPDHLARSGGIDLTVFNQLVPEVES